MSSGAGLLMMECCFQSATTRRARNVKFKSQYICRVKFGVPLEQVCKRAIPGPLLVSIFSAFYRSIYVYILLGFLKM
jgi:hypothetical protein